MTGFLPTTCSLKCSSMECFCLSRRPTVNRLFTYPFEDGKWSVNFGSDLSYFILLLLGSKVLSILLFFCRQKKHVTQLFVIIIEPRCLPRKHVWNGILCCWRCAWLSFINHIFHVWVCYVVSHYDWFIGTFFVHCHDIYFLDSVRWSSECHFL